MSERVQSKLAAHAVVHGMQSQTQMRVRTCQVEILYMLVIFASQKMRLQCWLESTLQV